MNVNNSHLILSQPEKVGTDLALDGPIGWDHDTLAAAGFRRYFFDVPADGTGRLTATATWLRRVPQSGSDFSTDTVTLANIDLRVFEADAGFNLVGGPLDASLSPIDNVEHLFTALQGGRRYAIDVSLVSLPGGQVAENFSVAWRVEVTPVPEPAALLAAAAAGLLWRRRARRVS